MSRFALRAVLSAVASLASLVCLAPSAGATCRIEPFGDSITYGWSSAIGGYRAQLVASPPIVGGYLLPIQMVGAQNDVASFPNLTALNQQYHSSVPGWRIDQLWGAVETNYPVYPGFTPPGIVLVHAGTNDIIQGWDAGTAGVRLTELLTALGLKYPAAKIIVALIVPFGPYVNVGYGVQDGAELNARAAAYNAQIPGVVAGLNAVQPYGIPRYFTVDMSSSFPIEHLQIDGVHPDDVGYAAMATRWRGMISYVASWYGC